MLTRRELLISAGAGVVGVLIGCRRREAVLKIPEDAAECIDLFRFFSDPKLDFEQAKNAFGLTGTPKVLQSTPSWRRHTFEDQAGAAKSVELNTSVDESYGEYFSGIYIDYRKPIGVSLSTLKNALGPANERSRQLPGHATLSPAAFTNIMPGQSLKDVSSFSFYPEPIAPGMMKVDLLVRGDATSWDTKTIDFVRFERRPA